MRVPKSLFIVFALAISTSVLLPRAIAAPGDLDHEAELTTRLESFLVNRVQRIVRAAGVRGDDFSTSAIVHLVKQAPVSPDQTDDTEKTRSPARVSRKKSSDGPSFMSFPASGSFLDADQVVHQYEQEAAQDSQDQSTPQEPALAKAAQEEPGYNIDHVYIQAALSEHLDPTIYPEVEKALHTSFDPIFGSRLVVEVKPYSKLSRPWYDSLFHWIKSFQWLTMEALLLFAVFSLFLCYKLIPHWQAKQSLKTEHTQNEDITESKESKPETPPVDEIQPEPEKPADPEPDAGTSVAEDHTVLTPIAANEQLGEEIRSLEGDLTTFAQKHPKVVAQTATDWAKANESASKIGFCIEFLSRRGIELGHIRMRADMIAELREWRKKHDEISHTDRLKLLKEIYWDLVATEHLSQDTTPSQLEFLTYVEDRILAQAMREVDPASQARIVGILGDRRSARLLDRLGSKERGQILERLLASGEGQPGGATDSAQVAKNLMERVKEIQLQQENGAKPSMEVLASILRGLAFDSQFQACRTLVASGSQSMATLFDTFFNVGLLPKAKDEFLAKVFLDRDTKVLETLFAAFDSEFVAKVTELLPPMQQRMLEGRDFSRVPRGESMSALKALNDEILGKIAEGKLSLRDIFDAEASETQWTAQNVSQAA